LDLEKKVYLQMHEESLREYTKYYNNLSPSAPGSTLAVIDFQDMEVNDLAGLAWAEEQSQIQNFDNKIVYAYAQYHIFLKTEKLENVVLAIEKLDSLLSAIDSTSPQYDSGPRTLVALLSKKFERTIDPPDLEAAVYRVQVLLSTTDRLDPERYLRYSGLMLLLGKYTALTGNEAPLHGVGRRR
jgi:hypothetical protein